MEYEKFLLKKSQQYENSGFKPTFMPSFLFDFQSFLVDWAVNKGRAAIFSDCGTGKTPMQLVWAQNVIEKTNKPVLILTPLVVSFQTEAESEKFGIDAKRHDGGNISEKRIILTNYERLHKFNANNFSGVVCDESSILKNFDGAIKHEVTEFIKKIPYRLLATATAAPNDFIELGTSSEALGYLGFIDTLNRFFKNDQNNSAIKRMYGKAPTWRFKGHSEIPFWRWVSSWARAMRKPSDYGFDDGDFILPGLVENEFYVEPSEPPDGMLFTLPAFTLLEQRAEIKRTITERTEKAAERVNNTGKPAIVWCHLNEEGKRLKALIPDSIEISGSDSDDSKVDKFLSFISGKSRVLITKPKIGAWGLNFQHCSHIVYFPSHSYEQKYQAVRRCYRFGQKNKVNVDLIMTEGEKRISENLKRKSIQADLMFQRLVDEMNRAQGITQTKTTIQPEIPSWM